MDNPHDTEMAALRRLIAGEAQAGLARFRRRDFVAALERSLRQDAPAPQSAWRRNPLLVPFSLAMVLLLATGVVVVSSWLHTQREIRELRAVLMRLPELRAPLPGLAPAPLAADEEQRILLSWIFKLAGERLDPGELSAASWRARIEASLAGRAAPETAPLRSPQLTTDDLRRLEKRIRRLLAAGEPQRLRRQDRTNRI